MEGDSMNMGMAENEMNEKLARLHNESIHDDGCATMYPGGKCNCTQKGLRRANFTYPHVPLNPASK
jgi:hypothetical protein